ncbi:MAG: hypothetical protein J7K87_03735 [Candidatus Aenigmarchaeota archaeon]|nr:hypothetical protein [Candidatus Aenigmarchaeota archaeon]
MEFRDDAWEDLRLLSKERTVEKRYIKMIKANNRLLRSERRKGKKMDGKPFYTLSGVLAAIGGGITYLLTKDPVDGAMGAYLGIIPMLKENVVDELSYRFNKWFADLRSDIYHFDEPLEITHPIMHWIHSLFKEESIPMNTNMIMGYEENLIQ